MVSLDFNSKDYTMFKARIVLLISFACAALAPAAFAQADAASVAGGAMFDAPVAPVAAVPGIVLAQPAAVAAEPAIARLADTGIKLASFALVIILGYLVGKLVASIEKKFKVQIPAFAEDAIRSLIDQGITYAEEQAHKAVKENKPKLAMSESLETAATFVMDLAINNRDIEALGKERIKKLIEARLGASRGV
jgi:hypothetical protein